MSTDLNNNSTTDLNTNLINEVKNDEVKVKILDSQVTNDLWLIKKITGSDGSDVEEKQPYDIADDNDCRDYYSLADLLPLLFEYNNGVNQLNKLLRVGIICDNYAIYEMLVLLIRKDYVYYGVFIQKLKSLDQKNAYVQYMLFYCNDRDGDHDVALDHLINYVKMRDKIPQNHLRFINTHSQHNTQDYHNKILELLECLPEDFVTNNFFVRRNKDGVIRDTTIDYYQRIMAKHQAQIKDVETKNKELAAKNKELQDQLSFAAKKQEKKADMQKKFFDSMCDFIRRHEQLVDF